VPTIRLRSSLTRREARGDLFLQPPSGTFHLRIVRHGVSSQPPVQRSLPAEFADPASSRPPTEWPDYSTGAGFHKGVRFNVRAIVAN